MLGILHVLAFSIDQLIVIEELLVLQLCGQIAHL